MEKDDARMLSPAAKNERRRQVIRAHKRGPTRTQTAEEVGPGYTAVSKTIARYEELGSAALAPRTRGRRSGQDRALSEAQEQAIERTICDKRLEQLKMEFALWSRAAVMHLIEREYAVVLHVRSVGKYLKRWGFTPKKPIRRAYEQSPAAVKEWLDTQYPQIARQAKAEGAEVHWGDETALVNTDVRGRSFAPIGKTPVTMAVGDTRQKLSRSLR